MVLLYRQNNVARYLSPMMARVVSTTKHRLTHFHSISIASFTKHLRLTRSFHHSCPHKTTWEALIRIPDRIPGQNPKLNIPR